MAVPRLSVERKTSISQNIGANRPSKSSSHNLINKLTNQNFIDKNKPTLTTVVNQLSKVAKETVKLVPNFNSLAFQGETATSQSPLDLCRNTDIKDEWSWGGLDVIKWKTPSWLGGDKNFLKNYKNTWVRSHANTIKDQARLNNIPAVLLAGVSWIEVGGDPDWIDSIAYPVRSFDHMADPLLEPLTITTRPELTSMGDVSIQVRRAAEAANLNINTLSSEQRKELVGCLSDEEVNIAFVAKHLSQLKKVDKLSSIGDEEIKILGARYNRGPDLSLSEIKENTSYGDLILKKKSDLEGLLRDDTK